LGRVQEGLRYLRKDSEGRKLLRDDSADCYSSGNSIFSPPEGRQTTAGGSALGLRNSNIARYGAIDAILIILSLLGVYRLAEKADVRVVFAQAGERVVVQEVLDPETADGFSPGDTVRTVNGFQVSSPDEIEFVLDALPIGESVVLHPLTAKED
jgi:hypothetical protein